MSVPLSDTRLTEIRERAAGLYEFSLPENLPAEAVALAGEDVPDLLAEVERLRALAAAEPVQPSPEHQAVYLDDFDQVWCDYPTVPAGDDVLPLVWASEQAQSRADLADGGNRLRVIGWCR